MSVRALTGVLFVLLGVLMSSCGQSDQLWQLQEDASLPPLEDVAVEGIDADFSDDEAAGCDPFESACPEEAPRCLPSLSGENRCAEAGALGEGDACVIGESQACGVGLLCAGQPEAQRCRTLCSPERAPCGEGQRCALAATGLSWGLCIPLEP